MDTVECVVVGAGVVGLAIGRELARRGREVVILEAEDSFGTITSSRNSEVIHAGIYYPEGSLKADLCVSGRRRLYDFCAEHKVEHRRVGKLIVATDRANLPTLDALAAAARANGVYDLRFLTKAEAAALEPGVLCEGALFSPSTGIIDSHGYMLALLGDLENAGGWMARKAPLTGVSIDASGGFELQVGGAAPSVLGCRILINSAGLSASEVAAACGQGGESFPKTYLAKGSYFSLQGPSPFSHLVYPVPVPGGLGTHATLDLSGGVRFGPDVEWVNSVDYTVDPARAVNFYAAVRTFWPDLPDGALQPAYSGVRPKLSGPGEPAADFLILDSRQHGRPGLVHLAGIESPGLTASLALAELVASIVGAD